MRILVLLTDAFGGRGGIAQFNRNFLQALCEHPECQEVIAIPYKISHLIEKKLPEKLTYVTSGTNNRIKYLWTVMRTISQNPGFDFIFCGHLHFLPVAWVTRLILRCPLITILHGIEAWKPRKNTLVNILVNQSDRFVSVSKTTQDRFRSWTKVPERRFFILPNCVDLNRFKPGPKNQELIAKYGLENKKVMMTLGRLVGKDRHKGFDEVLEVMPDLIKEIQDLTYLIVGDGPDRERLAQKTKKLGLSSHVIFTGYIEEAQKVEHYRLADIYVMPSKGEGFGIVYLEAIACGLPAVGSMMDGSREALLEGAIGILVNPTKHDDIKRGILRAIQESRDINPNRLACFSFEKFKERTHSLIE